MTKPRLSFWQILNMNFGFFGIQFSFGLQQGNMTPIYEYLGADGANLPLLWLAGPVTGLVVQPIVGVLSDRTTPRVGWWGRFGRRTPYFLVGALLCSLGLFLMPFSPALWVAAGLLWVLDAANNVTMEPYRAYVSDRLLAAQHSVGFLTQSAFTGLAQTFAYLTPTLLVFCGMDRDAVGANHIPAVTLTAFVIGAVFSITTVCWSIRAVPELPIAPAELAAIHARGNGLAGGWRDLVDAVREMPSTMRQLAWMSLLQWYGMLCYWIYIVPALALGLFQTTDPGAPGFREAGLVNGQIGGFYNFVAFVAAFGLLPFTRRFGPKVVHAVCLALAGAGMLWLAGLTDRFWLFVPMLGIGLAWASIMGNPYIMLAGSIPPERAGVYMGLFNLFIVVPMILQMLTLPLCYDGLLGGDPRNVVRLAGGLLLAAAAAVLLVRERRAVPAPETA